MKQKPRAYAFIDHQNINLGVRNLGWKVNWKRLRILLAERYGVTQAYQFIGFVPSNQALYNSLQEAGYILVFKPISWDGESGKPKGNVDADLVLQAMVDVDDYERAVVMSSDGDFWCLINYLKERGKLGAVISPKREFCSKLLRKAAQGNIAYLDEFRGKIEHREN